MWSISGIIKVFQKLLKKPKPKRLISVRKNRIKNKVKQKRYGTKNIR